MIITLKGANFSTNNINDLLSNYSISYNGNGISGTPSLRAKDAEGDLTCTINIADGYTYESLSVSIGGVTMTKETDYLVSGTGPVTVIIDGTKINGNIFISVVTSGGVIEPEEPDVPAEPDDDGVVFNFDFANNTLDKYVADGIITIPSTSTTNTVTYDAKGITTTGTATPACLGNGVKLTTPFDIGSTDWTFEVTMTLDPWQESFGMTEALYKNLVFVSADDHDTEAEYAHDGNCLAPAIYIDSGGLSLRGPDHGGATKKASSLFNPDGVEHTYKLSYSKDTDELYYYVDGTQKQKLAAGGAVGGTIQYLLGVHKGYSSAKNFALKMGMHVRLMKMYTE